MQELQDKGVRPLNQEFGSDTYVLDWRPSNKYLTIKCKVANCSFSIWFTWEADPSGKPRNIVWSRNVYISHLKGEHATGSLKSLPDAAKVQ
jgi:hypothetical protein